MMSSLGLDPDVPLPPVDDDSDLVGKNNKLGIPDDDPNGAEAPIPGVTFPIAGAGAYPLPGVKFGDEIEEAVGGDDV
jgi:hypothetical protein